MSEQHIARSGETEYAAIVRTRSGINAGNIDFGLRTYLVKGLSASEQQDICNIAFALYQAICRATGKLAEQEQQP